MKALLDTPELRHAAPLCEDWSVGAIQQGAQKGTKNRQNTQSFGLILVFSKPHWVLFLAVKHRIT